MVAIWEAIWPALQPVAVAVATVAVLALLRLITPTVRWSRGLKRDGEIYGALPEGKEKELWARSVTAQAERLRVYREDLSIGDQIVAWYAFFALALVPIYLVADSAQNWEGFRSFVGDQFLTAIPFAALLLINTGFALLITVRLIRGQSTALQAGTGGHYPKLVAVQRAGSRRSRKRAEIERRLAVLQFKAEREAKAAKRRARR